MATPRVVRISALNELQFAEQDKTQYAGYNSRLFTEGWWLSEERRTYQMTLPYFLKKRWGDTICIQADLPVTTAIGFSVEVYRGTPDGAGTLVYQFDENNLTSATLSGNTYLHTDGVEYPLYTVQAIFPLTDIAEAERTDGTYYVLVYGHFDEDDDASVDATVTHISEPISIKSTQPDTLLIEYSNSVNDFDTNFEQLDTRFALRIDGDIHSYKPGSTDTAFTDQGENVAILSSVPYSVYRLTCAGRKGIPDYMVDKLNHIFSCDRIAIDGRLFVKDDGAKWDLQEVPKSQLKSTSINLRLASNKHSLTTVNNRVYFWAAQTPPYAAAFLTLWNGVSFVHFYPNAGKIFEDTAAGEDIRDDINDNILEGLGLRGSVGYDSNHRLYYDNAAGENWGLDPLGTYTPQVYDKILTITMTTTGTNRTFAYSHLGYRHVIDWGEGGNPELTVFATSAVSHSNVYNTADTYAIRLFHKNGFGPDSINIQNLTNTGCNVDNITGEAASNCFRFELVGTNLDSAFNLTWLRPANGALQTIVFRDCGISHPVLGTLFDQVSSMPNSALPLFMVIDLRNNVIGGGAGGVNQIINSFFSNVLYHTKTGWHLKLEGQTPAAVPTSTAATQKTFLNSTFGSTSVTTD